MQTQSMENSGAVPVCDIKCGSRFSWASSSRACGVRIQEEDRKASHSGREEADGLWKQQQSSATRS